MSNNQPSNDWTTEQLIAALKDSDSWIRELAVMRLRDRQDPETFEPLLRMLNDPHSGVRMNAILALGRIGNPRAFEPLLALFTQTDDINLAARALAWLGDERAVVPLIDALNDPRPVMRLSAAEALGELHDRRAVEPLIVALTDPEVSVRQYAATALGNLGDQRAVEPLLQALATTKTHTHFDLANSVIQLHDAEGIQADAFEHFFRAITNTDPARIAMVNALAQLGDRRAVEPLIEIVHTEPGDVRCYAAGALGDLGDQKAFEPLLDLLMDEDDTDGARPFAAATCRRSSPRGRPCRRRRRASSRDLRSGSSPSR